MNIYLQCIGPLERNLSKKGMLDVGPGTTVQVLINELAQSGFNPDLTEQYCVVVNGKIADWDSVLADGDSIVIFLPLDGG